MYIIGIFVILLGISNVANYFQYTQNAALSKQIGELVAQKAILASENNNLKVQRAKDQANILDLGNANNKLQQQASDAQTALERLRGRLITDTIRKPSFIESLANKRWQKGLTDFGNVTNGTHQ